MRIVFKKMVLVSLVGLLISGCDVPEDKKRAARDAVISNHLSEILDYYKSRLEQNKIIGMPDLQQTIEMRECDKLIELYEDDISYYPNFISKVDHPYNFSGYIKPNQKHVACVIDKLLKARVPDKYLNNFAFSLYRKNITSEDYQGLVKKINADGVITYAEAIELYNFIHKNEVEIRSKESWSDSLARWFNEK